MIEALHVYTYPITNIKGFLVWVGLEIVPVLPVVGLHSLVWLIKECEVDDSLDPLWHRHIQISCADNTVELTCKQTKVRYNNSNEVAITSNYLC